MKQFLNGQCRAVVVAEGAYLKLSAEKKDSIKIIATSRKMPNQTISISEKISKDKRDKITQFLLSKAGLQAAEHLLQRFSKEDKQLIPAVTKDYDGLEELLEGVVYGW
jgi:ABC-type phosphate/phosphonate transport system substrate-binding protein